MTAHEERGVYVSGGPYSKFTHGWALAGWGVFIISNGAKWGRPRVPAAL